LIHYLCRGTTARVLQLPLIDAPTPAPQEFELTT
jgi:hypothetical protein